MNDWTFGVFNIYIYQKDTKCLSKMMMVQGDKYHESCCLDLAFSLTVNQPFFDSLDFLMVVRKDYQ